MPAEGVSLGGRFNEDSTFAVGPVNSEVPIGYPCGDVRRQLDIGIWHSRKGSGLRI